MASVQVVPTHSLAGGDGWLREVKHNGFRTRFRIDRGDVRAFIVAAMTGRTSTAERSRPAES